jgi:hypothetical protein
MYSRYETYYKYDLLFLRIDGSNILIYSNYFFFNLRYIASIRKAAVDSCLHETKVKNQSPDNKDIHTVITGHKIRINKEDPPLFAVVVLGPKNKCLQTF